MIGRQIGSYTVTGHLGSGGMGDVYRARDTRLGRDVAVKVLPAHVPDKNEGLARFEREARIVSGLNHPHILTIYEIGQVQLPGELGATHYIVTEFVDGVTMREAMNSREHDLRQMLEYLVQVVDALRKAHAAGVVHRDLKPENIMFTRDGYAKVLDFGLAKMFSPQNGERAANTFHTERGMTVGTIGYMAPEQIQGKPVDHRTDIFAFGCLLYELLAGDVPFAANDLVNVLYKITSAKPPPLGPHVDAALRQVVRRCLEKDPADRFQNVGEIAEVLRIVIARTGRGETAANRERLRTPSATRATSRVRVVAVMPFVNGSGDPETEYLSDGITESIIYILSQVRKRVRVIARNTVFAYKGKPFTPTQLAAELGATALVTGRVQRLGSTIVVAADLVRTADGSQLWGERFQRPFSDIFTVQEQIATSISDQLRLQLTTAERRKLAQRPTRRSDAYELYLKGRYHLNRRTADSAGPALAAFEQAVDVDPQYALAWAGIAEAHLWRRFLSSDADASDELCVLAERAARKAAALDPALADPHSTLGYLAMFRWDWRDAEREYRTALALNPDHANTHSWYSHLLMLMARREEALLEIRAAIEIEPLSHSLNVSYAGLLWVMGRNEQAEAVAKKVVELEPRFYFARWMMALASLARGHFEEAVTILERTVAECGQHPELLGTLGYAYARLDRKDEAMAILAEIDAVSHGKDHSHLAEVCLGLGDISAALRYAEHGFLKRGSINAILLTPQFAPLREDPRFEAMLARIGFPDPRQATFIPTTYQARAL